MKIREIRTPVLRQAYEECGPPKGEPLLLVHGWPDSPRTWDKVLPLLHDAGYRTITPYLRSYGPSKFRDPLVGRNPRRTGQPVAFAEDMIALADHLKLKRFHFIGHDWGARTGYALAALTRSVSSRLSRSPYPSNRGRLLRRSCRKLVPSGISGSSARNRERRSFAKIR
jgi:pimeloyl-ACP methyl ester carboxylesterase